MVAYDYVVQEGDFHGSKGFAENVGLADIGFRGLRGAAGVVVNHDYVAGLLLNGAAEHLTGIHNRTFQAAGADDFLAYEAVLAVEEQNPAFLVLEVPEDGEHELDYQFR